MQWCNGIQGFKVVLYAYRPYTLSFRKLNLLFIYSVARFEAKIGVNICRKKTLEKDTQLKKYAPYFARKNYLFSSYNAVEAATCSPIVIYITSLEY